MTRPPIPPAIPPCCIFWISQFIYFTFLAPSPRSMPIQYLFKHYFMPLARETFTFKFSNIPQSLVCKQHLSILQLFSLSEAVRIKPSHAQRGRRGRGPGHRAATELQSSPQDEGCPNWGTEGYRPHPLPASEGSDYQEKSFLTLLQLGSALGTTGQLHKRESQDGEAPWGIPTTSMSSVAGSLEVRLRGSILSFPKL